MWLCRCRSTKPWLIALTITTTSRLAGAVHSILWNGQEFIDSTDHGRQRQSACSFDSMSDDPFWAERYNPTEAGMEPVTDRPASSLGSNRATNRLGPQRRWPIGYSLVKVRKVVGHSMRSPCRPIFSINELAWGSSQIIM